MSYNQRPRKHRVYTEINGVLYLTINNSNQNQDHYIDSLYFPQVSNSRSEYELRIEQRERDVAVKEIQMEKKQNSLSQRESQLVAKEHGFSNRSILLDEKSRKLAADMRSYQEKDAMIKNRIKLFEADKAKFENYKTQYERTKNQLGQNLISRFENMVESQILSNILGDFGELRFELDNFMQWTSDEVEDNIINNRRELSRLKQQNDQLLETIRSYDEIMGIQVTRFNCLFNEVSSIKRIQTGIADLEKRLEMKDNILALKEIQLSHRDKDLKAKDNQLKELANQLKIKDDELLAKEKELMDKDKELLAKDKELLLKDREQLDKEKSIMNSPIETWGYETQLGKSEIKLNEEPDAKSMKNDLNKLQLNMNSALCQFEMTNDQIAANLAKTERVKEIDDESDTESDPETINSLNNFRNIVKKCIPTFDDTPFEGDENVKHAEFKREFVINGSHDPNIVDKITKLQNHFREGKLSSELWPIEAEFYLEGNLQDTYTRQRSYPLIPGNMRWLDIGKVLLSNSIVKYNIDTSEEDEEPEDKHEEEEEEEAAVDTKDEEEQVHEDQEEEESTPSTTSLDEFTEEEEVDITSGLSTDYEADVD